MRPPADPRPSLVATVRALARRALSPALRLLRRGHAPAADDDAVVRLEDVRRRLELLLAALYERHVPIVDAAPPTRRAWLRDAMRRAARRGPARPAHAARQALDARRAPVVGCDGARVHLPPTLAATDRDAAMARYRLLAVEQGARLARDTAAHVPAAPLERDLYLLREAVAVDASIARTVPGLRGALAAARAESLGARPDPASLTPVERAVDDLVRDALHGDALGTEPAPTASAPADSLAWAVATAARLRALGGRYRGLPPVAAWGTVIGADDRRRAAKRDARLSEERTTIGAAPHAQDDRRARGARATDAAEEPVAATRVDEAHGQGRRVGAAEPARRPASDDDDAATASGDAPPPPASDDDALPADDEGQPHGGDAGDGAHRVSSAPAAVAAEGTVRYPEWDWRAGHHRPRAVTVRLRTAAVGDGAWARAVLERHAPLVRQLRERFAPLRAQRTRLRRQLQGDELDLAACVRALVDRRTGHTVDDRLYAAVRPARRGLAIALLVDISGSTETSVGAQRIIDVEKTAVLLTSEALDALGDPYAVLTFSGRGADDVRLRVVKDFAERNGELVRRRVAALAPEGYTRLGAAVRHATALLGRQPAGHRLLLLLSDGRPNDVDAYEGRYGVEDARQAIHEARAAGVYPFCLTVDREGADYLGRIFGQAGHLILRRPETLPAATLTVVRRLLRA